MPRSKPTEPTTAVVFAKDTLSCGRRDGVTLRLTRGQCWAADDPICLERPDLFSPVPTAVLRSTPPHTVGELRDIAAV
jgi:hypothetical protein